MSFPSRDTFQNTVDGLDAGIQVRHIAVFDLACCDPSDLVGTVLDRKEWRTFSQFLVREEGHAVGILLRNGADPAKTVAREMRPLSDGMLISADAPVSAFLKVCEHDSFRLVVDRTRIAGIATVSDLQKLPVRLHAFLRICHLEMLMADIIRRRSGGSDDVWKRYVKPELIKKAERRRTEYERQDLNLPLIEYTDFGDKADALCGLFPQLMQERPELDAAERLRHETMHVRPVDETAEGVNTFLERLRLTDRFISRLHGIAEIAEQDEEKANRSRSAVGSDQ
jgi:hypothetical protein